MDNPYSQLCAAGAGGLMLWGCHMALWAVPVLSLLSLVCSLIVTGCGALGIIRSLLRRRRRAP